MPSDDDVSTSCDKHHDTDSSEKRRSVCGGREAQPTGSQLPRTGHLWLSVLRRMALKSSASKFQAPVIAIARFLSTGEGSSGGGGGVGGQQPTLSDDADHRRYSSDHRDRRISSDDVFGEQARMFAASGVIPVAIAPDEDLRHTERLVHNLHETLTNTSPLSSLWGPPHASSSEGCVMVERMGVVGAHVSFRHSGVALQWCTHLLQRAVTQQHHSKDDTTTTTTHTVGPMHPESAAAAPARESDQLTCGRRVMVVIVAEAPSLDTSSLSAELNAGGGGGGGGGGIETPLCRLLLALHAARTTLAATAASQWCQLTVGFVLVVGNPLAAGLTAERLTKTFESTRATELFQCRVFGDDETLTDVPRRDAKDAANASSQEKPNKSNNIPPQNMESSKKRPRSSRRPGIVFRSDRSNRRLSARRDAERSSTSSDDDDAASSGGGRGSSLSSVSTDDASTVHPHTAAPPLLGVAAITPPLHRVPASGDTAVAASSCFSITHPLFVSGSPYFCLRNHLPLAQFLKDAFCFLNVLPTKDTMDRLKAVFSCTHRVDAVALEVNDLLPQSHHHVQTMMNPLRLPCGPTPASLEATTPSGCHRETEGALRSVAVLANAALVLSGQPTASAWSLMCGYFCCLLDVISSAQAATAQVIGTNKKPSPRATEDEQAKEGECRSPHDVSQGESAADRAPAPLRLLHAMLGVIQRSSGGDAAIREACAVVTGLVTVPTRPSSPSAAFAASDCSWLSTHVAVSCAAFSCLEDPETALKSFAVGSGHSAAASRQLSSVAYPEVIAPSISLRAALTDALLTRILNPEDSLTSLELAEVSASTSADAPVMMDTSASVATFGGGGEEGGAGRVGIGPEHPHHHHHVARNFFHHSVPYSVRVLYLLTAVGASSRTIKGQWVPFQWIADVCCHGDGELVVSCLRQLKLGKLAAVNTAVCAARSLLLL